MTFEEFTSLCQEEWSKCKGEIVTLWLTENSYRELQQHAMEGVVLHKQDGVSESASRVIYNQHNAPSEVSLSSSTLVNPVTRNDVRMKLAKDQDVADCFSGRDRVMYSKVLS